MEKLTVHRALAELKLIDAKVEKGIEAIMPTSYRQGDGLVAGVWTEEEFTKNAEAKHKSITDLLERKVKVKSAIVASNAVTQVIIAGKQMSVADAIARKGVVIQLKGYIAQLRAKHRNAVASMNKNNDVVNSNIQKLLEMMFGKDNIKVDTKDIEAVREPYMKANKVVLIDPLKVDSVVEDLEKQIMDFEVDVDAVLSESNAVTFIEI